MGGGDGGEAVGGGHGWHEGRAELHGSCHGDENGGEWVAGSIRALTDPLPSRPGWPPFEGGVMWSGQTKMGRSGKKVFSKPSSGQPHERGVRALPCPRREGHLSCCARVDSVCWTVLIRCEFYALDYTLVYARSIRGHSLSIAFGLSVILRTFAFLAFDSLSL